MFTKGEVLLKGGLSTLLNGHHSLKNACTSYNGWTRKICTKHLVQDCSSYKLLSFWILFLLLNLWLFFIIIIYSFQSLAIFNSLSKSTTPKIQEISNQDDRAEYFSDDEPEQRSSTKPDPKTVPPL